VPILPLGLFFFLGFIPNSLRSTAPLSITKRVNKYENLARGCCSDGKCACETTYYYSVPCLSQTCTDKKDVAPWCHGYKLVCERCCLSRFYYLQAGSQTIHIPLHFFLGWSSLHIFLFLRMALAISSLSGRESLFSLIVLARLIGCPDLQMEIPHSLRSVIHTV